MRIVLTLALLIVVLAPSLASAGNPARCGRLTRQIEHYEGMAGRARAAGSEMWIQGMENHLKTLKRERLDGCESFAKDDQALAAFGHFLKLAAKGAVEYFSMGTF